MDPVSIVAAALAIVYQVTGGAYSYQRQRWGPWGHFLGLTRLVDTKAVQELHWNINTWTDEEVMAWKQSFISTCSAIQVAGAIFASVGLTALQLPNTDSTHWSARALLTCLMILGGLSVVFAASQQQNIAVLNKALDIRSWLSRGKTEIGRRQYENPYVHLPLESSVAALKQWNTPKVVLNLAVLLYTIGFGIYLLYSWIYHVEPDDGRNDFRNVFIAFVATVGCVCIYVVIVGGFAFADELKRHLDFGLGRSTTFAKPVSQQQLEEWLKILQDMQSTTSGTDEIYGRLETAISTLQTKWEAERIERDRLRTEYRERRLRTALTEQA
ncbi:hypothetical protein EDD36DRAFT_462013 [Exophiala viscosa]|uniref:Uncharacterized protein n=1 Tax=Exophiala viscosa TaxID=2486360 RepID=A0AAN6IGZ5_9EURO|nr:hypothetical protein EDD36DRAFT_462013 [Exophiala viscosa]